MELQELKRQSWVKELLQGKSGRGKTKTACEVALDVLEEGGSVLYADTESEGSTTLLNLIDERGLGDDIVEELVYRQVEGYEDYVSTIQKMSGFDLLVIDTLDHKHTYVLKEVTDAKVEADADWNQYPQIYSHEKRLMEWIGKPESNVLATLDPDSGKRDKPKGAQTNIQGYFNIVVDLYRDGDEWSHKIENWIGRSDLIGRKLDVELNNALSSEVLERL